MSNNGGPAFPRPAGDYNGTKHGSGAQDGMTLRDYFAAKAMQGLLACPMQPQSGPDMYARDAYALADAMLKVRGEP
jgi:hypothetical protein